MKTNKSVRYKTKVLFYSDESRTYVNGNAFEFESKNKEQLKKDFDELNILNDLSVYQYIITDLVTNQYTTNIKNLLK